MKNLIFDEEDSQPYLMQLPKTAVQNTDDHMDEDKEAKKAHVIACILNPLGLP
jgi:hypothetical protein